MGRPHLAVALGLIGGLAVTIVFLIIVKGLTS